LALVWLAFGDARPGPPNVAAAAASPVTPASVGRAAPHLLAPFTPLLDAFVVTLTGTDGDASAAAATSVLAAQCDTRSDRSTVAPSTRARGLALVHAGAGDELAPTPGVVHRASTPTMSTC
jgi:hypothetical protein